MIDCVEGGASVSFLWPMTRAKAEVFWRDALAGAARGERVVPVAEDAPGAIVGTVLLVLDTVTGDPGERLYARQGWQRVGEMPGYALYPDGRPCATTVFHRSLGA